MGCNEEKKPVLVIMAAGMGSRYGGLKQIDPIDKEGHIIIDFSIYDAIKAGFEKVIFIIKKENEADFRRVIGDRIEKKVQVEYAFQELSDLPEGFSVPEERKKPWGTAHAVLSCEKWIEGSFAVINADDYYGQHAFQMIYDYLSHHSDDEIYRFAMVGYILENTLTDHGYVARGICETDAFGHLTGIQERTHIERKEGGAAYTEDGENWTSLPLDSTVSMNLWGFSKNMIKEIKAEFPEFLEKNLPNNPLKCEYFLPSVVERLLKEGKAVVQVLNTSDKWYGVTYKEDKEAIMQAIKNLKDAGCYPKELWK